LNAKEFLHEYRKISKIIENKLTRYEEWKATATGITTGKIDGMKVQTTKNYKKMASAVENYVDIEKDIKEQINNLFEKEKRILRVLEQLPVDEYDVLHMIYIQNLRLYEVASKLEKSYSWVKLKHNTGINKVQVIMDNMKRGVS